MSTNYDVTIRECNAFDLEMHAEEYRSCVARGDWVKAKEALQQVKSTLRECQEDVDDQLAAAKSDR